MSIRKIILYPKSAMKPIILTDNSNQSLKDIEENVKSVLSDNKISVFSTSSDSLILRPSEIQAVLITKKDNEDEEPIAGKKTEYAEKLSINDDGNNK